MAKTKRTTAAKGAGERATGDAPAAPQDPLGRMALERVIGRTLARAAAALADRTVLTEAARDLLGGALTPQAALLAVAQAGHEALGSAARQAQRAAEQQASISRQLREDLLRPTAKTAATRPRKDDYVLRGKVVLPDGEPAGGLAVEAIDRDVARHDVLGAAITDATGSFQIVFHKTAFAERGEKEPEIVLSVGREGEPPLHTTGPAHLFATERQANITVELPKGTDVRAEADAAARLSRIAYAEALTHLQQQQFDELVKDVQEGLGSLITALQRQVGEPGAGPRAPRRRPP